MTEYIVSLRVSFITPCGVVAKTEKQALAKAKTEFNKRFSGFKKTLDDITEVEIEEDYIENLGFE